MIIAYGVAFALYTALLAAVGLYGYRQMQQSGKFGLEGRNINYWVTALSAHAADMSIWLFFGFPAAVYARGAEECWTVVGLLGGMWFVWRFIAAKLRTASEATGSTTLTHFLCSVAGDKKGYLTLVSSCLLVFFFLFYVAVGLSGIGSIAHFAFGVPQWVGVITSALFVTAYIWMGGYFTVTLIDAFQAIFLLLMILVVPAFTFWNLSLKGAFALTSASAASLTFTQGLGGGLINAFSWGLGYLGMPHILTKFMSIDSVKNVKKAQYVGLSFQALALSASAAIGILAHWYFTVPPLSSQTLFLDMVTGQFASLFAGFILCAMVAATISTLDAQLIVCASVIAKDLMGAKNPQQEKQITGWCTAVLATLGAWLALTCTSTMHEIVRYAWQGLGSTFAPLVLISLYAPHKLTVSSGIAGILAGGLAAALWPYTSLPLTTAPLIPGMCMGIAAIYFFPRRD